jgi:hypothetical protein
MGEKYVPEVIIRFPDADVGQANVHAQSLKDAILDEAPQAQVGERRMDPESQDFGASLAVVLAGPAVVSIAKGIREWLTRHHGVTIDIVTPDGKKVIAGNLTAGTAVEIINSAAKAGI